MENLKLIIVIISFWTQVNCFKMREKFQERKEEADVEVVTDPELDAECRIDQECVPIRSCEPVLQLLMNVKDEPKDSKWRSHTVNVVRERICGELAQNMICCPRDGFYDQVFTFWSFFFIYIDSSRINTWHLSRPSSMMLEERSSSLIPNH